MRPETFWTDLDFVNRSSTGGMRCLAVPRFQVSGCVEIGPNTPKLPQAAPRLDPTKRSSSHAPEAEADAMHALLVKSTDELVGCLEGSLEEAELAEIANVLEAYEAKRWPEGRIPGGKG